MATTINTQDLFDAKALKFGTSTESETYSNAFMFALRRTLNRLRNKTGMTVTTPGDVETDIDISDDDYLDVVSIGVDFYLEDTHLFTTQPIPELEGRFERALREAQRVYLSGETLNSRFGTLEDRSTTVEET